MRKNPSYRDSNSRLTSRRVRRFRGYQLNHRGHRLYAPLFPKPRSRHVESTVILLYSIYRGVETAVPVVNGILFFLFFSHLTYSRWTSSLPSCLWSLRIFPSLPGSRLTIFLSRCKFSTLTTRQPMVEFYLLMFPCFPLRKKEHKSYFGKNRTHDFRTSRCADYLLDHSGDDILRKKNVLTLVT